MRKLLVGMLLGVVVLGAGRAFGEERQFTVVNIEFEGSKVFVPSTLVVKKGDKVKVKVINNIKSDPNQHGFSIPAYNVTAVVTRGEPASVEFTADKAGIFPISCQLHPPHVGGQLIVME